MNFQNGKRLNLGQAEEYLFFAIEFNSFSKVEYQITYRCSRQGPSQFKAMLIFNKNMILNSIWSIMILFVELFLAVVTPCCEAE